MPKRWIPRSSSVGNYFSCLQRAAFDRALAQGMLTVEDLGLPERGCDDTKFADYGSRTHEAWQRRYTDTFGTPPPEDGEIEQQWVAASRLFADDLVATRESVELCATRAVEAMPEEWDGLEWVAELDCKPRGLKLTGHIDLIAPNEGLFVDLKTTGRKPDHNRPKPAHLYQIAAYSLMLRHMGIKPTKGYLLYVESIRARWAILCEVDVNSDHFLELEAHLSDFLKYLTSVNLFKHARPNIGAHCTNQFCPYVPICRDKYLPGPGEVVGETTPKKLLAAAAASDATL